MRAMRSLCSAPMARRASPRGMRPCSRGRWASNTPRVAGGEASIITNHLAVAAVVATETAVVATGTAVAETAMAAAGWATTAAEAATAVGPQRPLAPRDRLEATSLRASECLFPEGGLVYYSSSTKSLRAAILASCFSFWTVGGEDHDCSWQNTDSRTATFLAAAT